MAIKITKVPITLLSLHGCQKQPILFILLLLLIIVERSFSMVVGGSQVLSLPNALIVFQGKIHDIICRLLTVIGVIIILKVISDLLLLSLVDEDHVFELVLLFGLFARRWLVL